jgi:hypothetical protein
MTRRASEKIVLMTEKDSKGQHFFHLMLRAAAAIL